MVRAEVMCRVIEGNKFGSWCVAYCRFIYRGLWINSVTEIVIKINVIKV